MEIVLRSSADTVLYLIQFNAALKAAIQQLHGVEGFVHNWIRLEHVSMES